MTQNDPKPKAGIHMEPQPSVMRSLIGITKGVTYCAFYPMEQAFVCIDEYRKRIDRRGSIPLELEEDDVDANLLAVILTQFESGQIRRWCRHCGCDIAEACPGGFAFVRPTVKFRWEMPQDRFCIAAVFCQKCANDESAEPAKGWLAHLIDHSGLEPTKCMLAPLEADHATLLDKLRQSGKPQCS